MKKMNKKGFTLIEMLVVIAIIAVLVAIIIPTVTNATEKANAAANAANLRSILAEASIDYLGGAEETTGMVHYTPGENGAAGTFTVQTSAPLSKKCSGVGAGEAAELSVNTDGTITATYDEKDVTYFSTIAETGKPPVTTP